jgi:hypothetical protein
MAATPPANMNQPPPTFHMTIPARAVTEWNHMIAIANVPAVNTLPGPARATESLIQRAILQAFVNIATQNTASRRALTK